MKKVIVNVLISLLIIVLVLIPAAITWLLQTWARLSYSELLFHLKSTIDGTSSEMVIKPLVKYGIPALLIILVCIIVVVKAKAWLGKKGNMLIAGVLVVLLIADIVSLSIFDSRTRILSDFFDSVTNNNQSTFIEDNYVDPKKVSMKFPEKKQNLIYIYLESMESTFSDEEHGGAFPEDVIPNLTEFAATEENFTKTGSTNVNGGYSLPGTDWTMGGMFAQSTGLPLKVPFNGNVFESDGMESFFPTVLSIGDILKQEGYRNMLSLGSDATFGGRRLFFGTHGDYEIRDYNYAIDNKLIPEDYKVWWGFEDEKLFDFAKNDLLELAAGDQPFNYTMLTVDTHFEDGYVCRLCDDEFGDNQYANVMACSDRQVTEFLKWIQEQDFYDDTVIVINGDHITMDSDFCDDVDSSYLRKTYSCIVNGKAEKKLDEDRDYCTFDMFPTTLAALGVECSSDRLGVGTNLYSDTPTLVEEEGYNECFAQFSKASPFLEEKSMLSVDEGSFELAATTTTVEAKDDKGKIQFVFNGACVLNSASIKELYIVTTDENGDTKRYDFDFVRDEHDKNGWYGIADTNVPFEENDKIKKYDVYISMGDYSDYLLKTFDLENPEESE